VPKKVLGNLGENLVTELLEAQGWQILATQWHCRLGELDIVACDRQWLIFVEVKTRSVGNWDLNGALAVTKSKQRKIYLAALKFLGLNPHLANLSCRFDVALVVNQLNANQNVDSDLYLHDYIESAFNGEEL
jgi:putative endonuclease